MKKLLLFLSAIVATVSCTNEIAETPTMEEATTKTISVAVAANSVSDTRVDVTDDGAGGYTVAWNAADQLGAWGTDDEAYYQSKFTIASDDDYDADNSTFTGSLPWNTTEMRFIHPYNSTFSQTGGVVSMSLASQSVTSDLSNLSSNTYMVSNAFEIESVSSYTSATKSDISMSHLGAAIDLRIKLDDSSDFTLTQLVVSELPTAAEVDMTDDATLTVTKTGAITLTVDNVASVDGIATTSFNTFPFALAIGEALSFEATLFDSNEKYYTATATITASEEVAFSRATRNTVYVKLSDVVATETPQETITITHDDFSDYSSSSKTFTGEVELDGADFYANSIYAYSSTYVSAGTSGYLFNLTSLEGLSKLVISYQNSNYYTVYEGSAVNPLASEVTPSVDEDTNVCTYEITAGNTFFTIVRETTSYVNALSIVAHYDTLGATSGVPAQFTGLNPSTIAFDSDDTTAQTVTINGSYLENGSISVSVDSSKFKVSSVASDYTFTVAPAAANNTDAAYTATVTVTVDETEYTMAVLQLGTTSATLTTTTITGDDFLSGGYTVNDGAQTIQDIDFYVVNCYLNSSSIQMAKSSYNTNGAGAIYNTSALNGLSQLKIDVLTNSVYVYAGETENPTTLITGADGIYIIPDGYKYFKVTATSSYAQVTSIAITYENVEGALPSISTDVTSITLDTDGGSADIELTTKNYTGEAITAVSSNNKFTTSVSGSVVTVSAGANSTDEMIYGTVTISVEGGNSIEVAVSQKTNTLTEQLIVDFSTGGVIGTSSYSAIETELTQDGITFGYVNSYKNSSYVLQMNNTSERACMFYNKTAISGLSKVEITISDANTRYFSVNAGSTQSPDDAEVSYTVDGLVYTYTITDGSEYFMIEPNTTGATYATSVKIYAIQ